MSEDDDNVFERMNDPPRLPKGWVTYVENPLDPEKAVIVRCPLSAAPAWVRRKHAGEDRMK